MPCGPGFKEQSFGVFEVVNAPAAIGGYGIENRLGLLDAPGQFVAPRRADAGFGQFIGLLNLLLDSGIQSLDLLLPERDVLLPGSGFMALIAGRGHRPGAGNPLSRVSPGQENFARDRWLVVWTATGGIGE